MTARLLAARLLAARLPATAAEDTARREQETARLHKRLRKIDAAETAHAREIENLASLPKTPRSAPNRAGPRENQMTGVRPGG